jgi:outer membrane biosynthesis protein TonB
MEVFEDKNKRDSLIITSILYLFLILLLFISGLKYLDPPPEGGIAVNFGTSDAGSGEVQPTEPVKTAPQQSTPPPPQESEPTPTETSEEPVVTQDNEDAPVIEEKKKEKKREVKEEKKKEPQPKETPEKVKEPEPEPEPTPSKNVTDAMKSILAGKEQDGNDSKGEGDDKQGGDKGDPDGDFNATSYYGKGKGLDGDENYRLGGRKALSKTKYVQDCNETGVVVVRIEVNQQGVVTKVEAGVRGTTNYSKCLLEPAERAARDTKFNADAKAPSRQVGEVTYEFRLSE